MAETSALKTFADILSGRASAMGEQAAQYTEEAYGQPRMGGKDAFMAGLIALAPLIAGAIKGKKGLHAGAVGGAMGLQAFDKTLDEEQKRRQAQALTMSKAALAEQKSLRDKSITAEMEGLKSQEKEGLEMRKLAMKKALGLGGGVTVKLPPGYEGIPEGQAAKIQEALDIYTDSIGIVDNIKGVISDTVAQGGPDFSKESILSAEGDIDFSKAWNLIERAAVGSIKGGEDPRQNIMNMVKAWADKYNKVITGAAQTDKEFARRYKTIIQEGQLQVTPSTIPAILDMISYLGNTYRSKAESRYDAAEVLTQKGFSPQERRTRFNELLSRAASGAYTPSGYETSEPEPAAPATFADQIRGKLGGGR